MERHCENAKKVAGFLEKHAKVKKVIYPSLMEEKYLDRAKKYLEKGFGALLGFELKDGVDAGKKFIDNLKLFYHVANIGVCKIFSNSPLFNHTLTTL